MNVVGSKTELLERSTAAVRDEDLPELRPAVDRHDPDRLRAVREHVARIKEVGDVWLDAGIVPFSTLGWQSSRSSRDTGRCRSRLTTADLSDHAYWEQWYPADWVSEMREQIRLWFYSQLFMSVVITGKAPFRTCSATRRCLTSTDARCTARGATSSRPRRRSSGWAQMSCAGSTCQQPPDRNLLRLRACTRDQAQASPLELRLVLHYLRSDRGLPSRASRSGGGPAAQRGTRALDRWLLARVQQFTNEVTTAYERS